VAFTRAEIDEMLKRSDDARVKLRRATIELQALGAKLLADRGARNDDRPR
jgi:hypothetical protein